MSLDEIWDLTESVSEGFPTYFFFFLCEQHKKLCNREIKSSEQNINYGKVKK